MATIENGSSKTKGREIAEEVYSRLFQGAREIVATGQEHAPILIIENEYGPPVILGGHEFENKDHIAYAHRQAVTVPGVTAAALIMEAWVYAGNDEKIIDALTHRKLSVHDLPEKTEALIFNIRAEGEQYIAMCKIDRTTRSLEHGKLFDPSGKESGGKESGYGRMVGDGTDAAEALNAHRRAN
jgi:hypothetical protein